MAEEWYDDDELMLQSENEKDDTEWSCFCSYLRANRKYVSMEGKSYDMMATSTATGVVKDAAMPTDMLNTPQERKKHEDAKNLFAAWSILYGVKQLERQFGENLDWQNANTAAAQAYDMVQNNLKKLQLKGTELNLKQGGIRKQLYNWLTKKYSSLYRLNCMETPDGKLIPRGVPLQFSETDDDTAEEIGMIPLDALICETAAQWSVQKDKEKFLYDLIDYAKARKILDLQDVQILQMYFGFGKYKQPMRNGEIARELKWSDGTVTNRRNAALQTLKRLVRESPQKQQKYEELFR